MMVRFLLVFLLFALVSTVIGKAVRDGTPFSEIVGEGEFAVQPVGGVIAFRFTKGKACSMRLAHVIGGDELVYLHAEVENDHVVFHEKGVPFGGKDVLDLAIAVNGSWYDSGNLLGDDQTALFLETDGSVKFNVTSITNGCSFPIVKGKVVLDKNINSTGSDILPAWAIACMVIGGVVVIAGIAGLLFAFRRRISRLCRSKRRTAAAPLNEAVVEPIPAPVLPPVPAPAPEKSPEAPVVSAPPPPPPPPPPAKTTTIATTEATTTPTATPPPPQVAKPPTASVAERPRRRSAPEFREPVRKSAVSSGSSGRKRSKKLLQNTFDFVEPDKVTGVPRRRSEPRSRPAPPPSEEVPAPTASAEQQSVPGLAGVVKAKAEAVADACCLDDKGGKAETTSKDDAKPPEKMLTYPLTDASEHPSLEEQGRPEEPQGHKAKRSRGSRSTDKNGTRKSGSRQSR